MIRGQGLRLVAVLKDFKGQKFQARLVCRQLQWPTCDEEGPCQGPGIIKIYDNTEHNIYYIYKLKLQRSRNKTKTSKSVERKDV